MKTLWALLPLAIGVPAFGQTTNTDCRYIGSTWNCTSQTSQPIRPSQGPTTTVNPNAYSEAFSRHQAESQQQRNYQQQQALMQQQQENLRLQNELLRQQQVQAVAPQPSALAPISAELIAAETAVLRQVFVSLALEQRALPEAERAPVTAWGEIVYARATRTLGYAPHAESIRVSAQQIREAFAKQKAAETTD